MQVGCMQQFNHSVDTHWRADHAVPFLKWGDPLYFLILSGTELAQLLDLLHPPSQPPSPSHVPLYPDSE